MKVVERGFAEGLQDCDGYTELPAARENKGDGEHHAVVHDVPTDGFAEGALSRIHYLFLEDLIE